MSVSLPASHLDLAERPILGRLTTLMPDGYPQTHPVWFDFAEGCLRINTMREFRKAKNMDADPRVTMLLIDPANSNRWMEVRGMVELTSEGAMEHLDGLARRYAGVDHYFGGFIPAELEARETPVLSRTRAVRVVTNSGADAQSKCSHRIGTVMGPADTQFDVGGVPIPATHLDLLSEPLVAALSTLMPDGHPQTQPVWFDFDGTDVLFNTTRERRKGRNLAVDHRAALLVVDTANSSRWIEIRGDVEMTEVNAVKHLDELTVRYTGKPHYYGWIYPESFRERETRIKCRIHARRIVCDAIHG